MRFELQQQKQMRDQAQGQLHHWRDGRAKVAEQLETVKQELKECDELLAVADVPHIVADAQTAREILITEKQNLSHQLEEIDRKIQHLTKQASSYDVTAIAAAERQDQLAAKIQKIAARAGKPVAKSTAPVVAPTAQEIEVDEETGMRREVPPKPAKASAPASRA